MGTQFTGVTNKVTRSDASQLAQLFPPINALEHGQAVYAGTTSGTSTAYTAVLAPAPPEVLPEGFRITIKPHATCGTAPTLALAGGDPVDLVVAGAAAAAGNLVAGRLYDLVYDGSAWQVVSAGAGTGGGGDGPPVVWGAEVIGYPTYYYQGNGQTYDASISAVTEFPVGLIDDNGDITIPEGVSKMCFWFQVSTSYCNVVGHLKCVSGTPTENVPYSWVGNNGMAWPTTQSGGFALPSPVSPYGCYRSARIPVTPGHVYRVVNRCQSHNNGGQPYSDGWEIISFGFELFA